MTAGAVAELESPPEGEGPITVTIAELQTHITQCAAFREALDKGTTPKEPVHGCSDGTYLGTVNSAGKVTLVKEHAAP